MTKRLRDLLVKAKSYFFKNENGKEVLDHKKAAIGASIGVVTLGGIGYCFSGNEDSSFLAKSERPISIEQPVSEVQGTSPKIPRIIGQNISTSGNTRSSGSSGKVLLRATQVIVRDNSGDPDKTMPIGTNLIGKTLTAIDSREPGQLVKILLPYGGRVSGGVRLDKNTILFGTASYNGKGDKVTVAISKGLTTDGHEFNIEAQALNPGDYSPGIVGETHSKADARILTAVGLSVVAATSEILTERENMANGMTMPKVTASNVAYRGLSQAAQNESGHLSDKTGDNEDFVTVPVGSDLIVSLTKSYVEQESDGQTKK